MIPMIMGCCAQGGASERLPSITWSTIVPLSGEWQTHHLIEIVGGGTFGVAPLWFYQFNDSTQAHRMISWDGSGSPVYNTPTGLPVDYIPLMSHDGDYFYAATGSNVMYRSSDGINWASYTVAPSGNVGHIVPGLTDLSVNRLIVAPNSGSSSRYSDDNGATWSDTPAVLTARAGPLTYSKEYRRWYKTSSSAIYSYDGESPGSWSVPVASGAAGRVFDCGDILISGSSTSGQILRSVDGSNFSPVTVMDGSFSVSGPFASSGELIIGTPSVFFPPDDRVLISYDYGQTWSLAEGPLTTGNPESIQVLTFSQTIGAFIAGCAGWGPIALGEIG